jgi:REP element-mobilizing transposase RayT
LVTDDIERALHRCIASVVSELGCTVLAIGGVADHVHLVVKCRSTISPAELAKRARGVSSTLARERLCPSGFFGWQDRYAVFSVSPWDVRKVMEYVRRQKSHHAAGTVIPRFELSDEAAYGANEDAPQD